MTRRSGPSSGQAGARNGRRGSDGCAWPRSPEAGGILCAKTGLCRRSCRAVVLSGGRLPLTDRERALFREPRFSRGYAPIDLRRGATRSPTVWSGARRRRPGERRLKRAAWRGRRRPSRTRPPLCASAEAAAIEPRGPRPPSRTRVGHRSSSAGLARAPAAAIAFEEARSRDPACVLAALTRIARDHARRNHACRLLISKRSTSTARLRTSPGACTSVRRVRLSDGGGEGQPLRSARTGDARLLVNHGVLLWRRGAAEEARVAWRRAITLDPQQVRDTLGFEAAAPAHAPGAASGTSLLGRGLHPRPSACGRQRRPVILRSSAPTATRR